MIFLFRARHAREVSDEHIYFEDAHPAAAHNSEDDGRPD